MVFRREAAGDRVGRVLAVVSKNLSKRGNRRNQRLIRFGFVGIGWGGFGGGVCTPKPVTKTLIVQSLEETASSSLLALCEPMLPCE